MTSSCWLFLQSLSYMIGGFLNLPLAIFIHCSHQVLVQTHHNYFSATLYQLLCWLWEVYLFRYCWPFLCQCLSCVETIQLICIANLKTGFYVGLALAWKRLSSYLYDLVFINLSPFNCRFVMVLLRTVLESNQVSTDVFKNVKTLSKCEF